MKYSIVIPTYNHCDDLLKPCIDSIIKYTDLEDIEIIIVANGCTDNTKEYVTSLGSTFKLIWIDEALGYTKANNIGLKAATGEFILMLNNDTEVLASPKNQWLEILSEPLIKNNKMVLTGSLMLHDHDIKHDFIVFCCAMIKRSILFEIGLPDEIFSPGYGEDIDFSMRVLKNGYQWKCVDNTVLIDGMHVGTFPIWHKGNKTFGEIDSYSKVTVEKNRKILIDRYVNNMKQKQKFKYSVIIPTYNHCDDLLKPCIDSILKYTNMRDVELIISANGCIDNTKEYLNDLSSKFKEIGFEDNIKVVWHDKPLGYSKACNVGIAKSNSDLIVLLNNDTVLLPQAKSDWLSILENPFNANLKCGVSCIIKGPSEPAGHDFAVFFCVMIHKKVFDAIGLLNEEYGVGGGEDTEFSIEAEKAGYEVVPCLTISWSNDTRMFTGNFPIYHKGEGTVHDPNLVSGWNKIFLENSLRLAKKYNTKWYDANIQRYQTLYGEETSIKLQNFKEKLKFLETQDEYIFNEIFNTNIYDLDVGTIKNREYIDVGANIGCFTVLASYLDAKKIIAIEPVANTFSKLLKNIQEINTNNVVALNNAAGADDDSYIRISNDLTDPGLNSVFAISDKFDEVKTVSLHTILQHLETDNIYLKCDCEGGEYDLLLNATTEDLKRISEIAIEIHEDIHPVYKGSEILHDKFITNGFRRTSTKRMQSWFQDHLGNKIKLKNEPVVVEKWQR